MKLRNLIRDVDIFLYYIRLVYLLKMLCKWYHFDTSGDLGWVTVHVKGLETGTIWSDGKFIDEFPSNFWFSNLYVGMQTQLVAINGRTTIQVYSEDTELLDDLLVVDYAWQRKKLITVSTVQVDGDNLTKLSTTSALVHASPGAGC